LIIASATPSPILISNQLTAAYVYPGGSPSPTTLPPPSCSPLLAPTGYGVTNIALVSGGANYIGAPGGQNHRRLRHGRDRDRPDQCGGVITILVPLWLWLSAHRCIDRTVAGWRPDRRRHAGTVSFGANTNSGGLVKTGTGTLTLGASNTYGGATIISAGNLQARQRWPRWARWRVP